MDPQACWAAIIACYGKDYVEAADRADDMLKWIEGNGFPPTITGNRELDELIVRETCRALSAWDIA